MKRGTLYGIGVGPGDPDLITVKAVGILESCPHVFVPKARHEGGSVALGIAEKYINGEAEIHELIFPMTTDRSELEVCWEESARAVAKVLESGSDACFLTLGDAFLYSTYIYLIRALRNLIPDVEIVTTPGVTAFSAAAALAEFPIGEAKELVTIVPTADNPDQVKQALSQSGTVVLMKIGKRLERILDLLDDSGALERSVLVSRAGMRGQRIVKDVRSVRGDKEDAGYLSVILVRGKSEENV